MLVAVCFVSACDLVGVDKTNDDSTPPTVPSGLQVTAPDPQRVVLQWSASSDSGTSVAGYRVFRSDLSTAIGTVTATSYTDTTVAPATTYGYFVTAFDGATPANESGPTSVVQVRTPSAADIVAPDVPANVQAVATGPTQVNLSWDVSADTGGSGLAGYRIFRNGNTTPVATVATASYSDTNLTAGTAYSYVIRAMDGAGNVSGPSNAVSVTTPIPPDSIPPTVPGSLTATAQGASAVLLNWIASTDASGIQRYEIQRDGVKISDAPGNATSFVDSAVSAATTYSYAVRAIDGANNASAFSNVANVTTSAATDTTPPTAPSAVAATANGSQSIVVTWIGSTDTGGSGLAGYRVFRDGGANPVGQVGAGVLTYTDSGLAPNSTHTYVVRAFDSDGNVSTPSNSASATTSSDTTAPSVPTNVVANALASDSVRVTWSASTDTGGSGLAGYRIYRNGTQLTAVGAGTTTFTDATAAPGTAYAYRVSAIDNAGNESAQSTPANVTTPADSLAPSAPANLTAAPAGANQITLTWNASSDTGGSALAGYRVTRDGTQIAQVSAGTLTFADTGLAPLSMHSYTVRAFDNAANVSPASNVATATTGGDATPPSAPAGLTATAAGSTQINLAWNASSDAGGSGLVGYRIFRGGTQVAQVASGVLSFADTGLSPNTNYSYVVRAIDGANNVSGPSNTAQATTAQDTIAPSAPSGLVATALSSTSVRLVWNGSTDTGGAGLAGYRVFRGGAQIATGISGTTYTDNTVAPNTSYAYTVRALDNAGNASSDSNTASVTTPTDTTAPSAPSGLATTSVTETQVGLTWNASTDTGGSGLAGYRVFRNAAQIATGIILTSYTDTTVTGVTYTYTVRAVDNAGNVSADSNSVQASPQASQPSGLDSRPSNTTCIAPNQPTTNTSVATQRVFPSLSFTSPILLTEAPGEPTNRWYVVEQRGTIRRFEGTNPSTTTQWADLQSIVDDSASESGLLGMAFHPNYASNGRVFLSYTGSGASPFQSHISEFRRGLNGLLDPTTERILLRLDQPFDNHNGGNILFGPDGNLYIGFGDGGSGGDPGNRAQNRNLLFGKILRINVDGANPYAIPANNPYVGNGLCSAGSGSASCPEIYAYGLRNPWRWSFDRSATDPDLWLSDVGQDSWEEVDRIVKGGNYGWRIREGRHCFNPSSNCPLTANGAPLIDPIAEYDHSLGQSITGGYVYRGTAIASLRGRYVFADFSSGRLMYLATNSSGGFDRRDLIQSTGLNISSFAEDSAGELYVVDYNGGLYQIVPGSGTINDTVPANLIDTGCVSMADPKLPASGLIPYAPNAAFWSDGAAKERWMALPNNQTITIQSDGDWSFPSGTVLVKHFRLGTRLIETRLFMRHPDTGNWGGYTYQWNSAQTAATLVKGGLITNINPPGQDWIYPSEAQCLQCHTSAAGRSLGLETAQLNSNLTYPATGRMANQLATLNAIGMFTTPLAQPPSALPVYPDPYGTSGSLTERARAYLHTNCSQCHRPSGGTPSNMDLRFGTASAATNACNATPASGDLGISGARLIVPGNPAASLIFVRMSRRDLHQMPPLASNLVDTAGVALIQSWIAGMNSTCQ